MLIVYCRGQKREEKHERTLLYFTTISHTLSWCCSLWSTMDVNSCKQSSVIWWWWVFLCPSCHWLALKNVNSNTIYINKHAYGYNMTTCKLIRDYSQHGPSNSIELNQTQAWFELVIKPPKKLKFVWVWFPNQSNKSNLIKLNPLDCVQLSSATEHNLLNLLDKKLWLFLIVLKVVLCGLTACLVTVCKLW